MFLIYIKILTIKVNRSLKQNFKVQILQLKFLLVKLENAIFAIKVVLVTVCWICCC